TEQLVAAIETRQIGASADESLSGNHAAMYWLTQAQAVEKAQTPEGRAKLAEIYEHAANAGGSDIWDWLADLNLLRLRMDNPQGDAAALLNDYESLARDMRGSGLASMAWADAAVIAGERLKDPDRALGYLANAEKHVTGMGAMAVMIADLK